MECEMYLSLHSAVICDRLPYCLTFFPLSLRIP